MAVTKKKSSQKLLTAGGMRLSWRRMAIVASVTLNIAFVVVWISFASTNSLDGLFMENGLTRYCSKDNDDKFKDSEEQVKALRSYVCDTPDAHQYFKEGFVKYLEAKNIPHAAD